jgi:tryptophan halogenase
MSQTLKEVRMAERLDTIVIVGGGTAGWMAAAGLAKNLRNGHTRIQLVESDAIGIVGVGEATIPPIRNFLSMLEIDENDFVRNVQGTFKLGIEFVDWYKPGHRYLHPFGRFGQEIDPVLPFHQYFLRYKELQGDADLESFSMTSQAARMGKFASGQQRQMPPNHWTYAYHFDASLVAKYLRQYAEARGVERIEGKVNQVALNDAGFIRSISLESGQEIEGDFFIDCTGFRSLLLGGALGVEYQDWTHYLPCNRAVAVPSEKIEAPIPYTRSTAQSAGWQWRIPLQHRTGNGYVYSSAHLSDDEASATLLANLDGKALDDPRLIPFTTGRREVVWKKNCLALGLSAGFLEPLESTAIHLIQTGVAWLLALLPDKSFNPTEIDEYNRIVTGTYEQTRDFLILHYKATERADSDFWNHCRNMDIPPSLARRMALFRNNGRCLIEADELFALTSWLAVLMGQGVTPQGINELANSLSEQELLQVMEEIKGRIGQTAGALPAHGDYIAQFCAA